MYVSQPGFRVVCVELQHRLDAVSNVKLLHDVRHVMLYSSIGAFEASRDLFVGHTARNKREDFPFARRKILGIIAGDRFDSLALADQQSRRKARRNIRTASSDGSQCLDHLMSATAL